MNVGYDDDKSEIDKKLNKQPNQDHTFRAWDSDWSLSKYKTWGLSMI